jgi:hypothetical protein
LTRLTSENEDYELAFATAEHAVRPVGFPSAFKNQDQTNRYGGVNLRRIRMCRRITGIVFVVCAFAVAMLMAGTAWTQSASQEKAPVYTYVSQSAVPRAMRNDYQKSQAQEDEMMKKLVADGTLVSFGSFSVLNHQEGAPTHGTWFEAHSVANLMKVLEGLRAAPDSTNAVLSASKHWDYIMESRDYRAHSGTFKNGYLRVGH